MSHNKCQRTWTKVYSGTKTNGVANSTKIKIPTLFDLSLSVIKDNIEMLEETGGVPYAILEPVLIKSTAEQLLKIEEFNPYLIENTDGLWKMHSQFSFKGSIPQKYESWRELFFRLKNERESRLELLTSRLKHKIDDTAPARKAKLAYLETSGGTKFNKSKAATIKSGMISLKTRDEKGIRAGNFSSAHSGGNKSNEKAVIVEAEVVIKPKKIHHFNSKSTLCQQTVRRVESSGFKKKKAPLMLKALSSMKSLMRR